MLKKLFKEEWKRFFPAPTVTLIILTVLTLAVMGTFMTSFWDDGDNIFVEILAFFSILAYIFSLAAFSFCITLCTAIRFYKNFFTDEGYLMFTLPVKTSELLLSKLLVAVLWRLISILFIWLSIVGIASVAVSRLFDTGIVQFFREFTDLFRELFSLGYLTIPLPVLFLWIALFAICEQIFSILFIYTCICLGQLWGRHKIGGAIISYFVLRFIFRLFRQLFTLPLSEIFSIPQMEYISFGSWLVFLPVSLLVMGALCLGLYCTCNYIMTKKLNLD